MDFSNARYSVDLIREYSDPEVARAAEEYEREALGRKASRVEQNSRTERKPRASKRTKNYRINKWKMCRTVLICLALIFLVGVGAVAVSIGNFDKIDTGDRNFAIDEQVSRNLKGYRNIAILGSDARSDEGYDGSRTDAIIIMSIKKLTGDVKLTSVMRDSYLKMEHSNGNLILDKITHANHWVDGVNTCASLNRSLDLNIDEFILFNWESVADVVDVLGGIKIDVKQSEIDDLNKYGHETALNVGGEYERITDSGSQTLDGVQAVTYCRIRKSSGGDSSRSQRYKAVMAGVMKKALLKPYKISSLSKEVFPNIRTNMSRAQFISLGLGFPRYDIKTSKGWPYDYYSGILGDGISYVVPTTLTSNVRRFHERVFDDNGYQPSTTCEEISQQIIYDTGIQ